MIKSDEGVQQGDPLGPLFRLTMMGIMEHLRSELYIFYLADCTLGGTVETVLHSLQVVEQEAAIGPSFESIKVRGHCQGPQHQCNNA